VFKEKRRLHASDQENSSEYMMLSAKAFRRLFPSDIHHMDGFRAAVDTQMAEARLVLDLGCGDNSVLAPYRSSDREVWGTDFVVHPRLWDPDWFRPLGTDGKVPFPDGTFDLVVCISVLEHVADSQAFLGEVARLLKPRGYFVAHSISGNHYVTWIRRAFGLLPHSSNQLIVKKLYGRDEVDTFPAFYRLNSQASIDHAARRVGLMQTEFLRYADQGYFAFFRPLVPTAIALDWLLARISSSWGRLYFTVTLRKIAPQ
jgi:SAM-dependent methyltransferase